MIIHDEFMLGYPEHFWLIIGHLAEAESEILEIYPLIAMRIRERRLELMENDDADFDVLDIIKEVSDE